MKLFLTVIFLINGEPVILDGYMPREQVSADDCNEHAAFLEEHAEDTPDIPDIYAIGCVWAANQIEAARALARGSEI